MVKSIGIVCGILTVLFLCGCRFDRTVTLHLQKDGSGTLTVSEVVYKTEEERKKEQELKPEASKTEVAPEHTPDEAAFRSKPEKYGKGLTPVSIRTFKTQDGGEGEESVYRFSDINAVVLNDDACPQQYSFSYAGGVLQAQAAIDLLKNGEAKMQDGFQTTLREVADAAKKSKEESSGSLTFVLTVEGNIKRTDATHSEAQGVTLFKFDGYQLMRSPEALKRYQSIKITDTEAMKAAAKEYPYFMIELKNKVTIEF